MSACELCPRSCGVARDEGQRGICGIGDELLVAHEQLHRWEEPSISACRGSGTIFFSGCPLQCVYCQNASISREAVGSVRTPEALADDMVALVKAGAHNINFVTPTHMAPQIREAVRIAREKGFSAPIVWNTSGYETVQAIRANKGFVDVYLTDFKYASELIAHDLSGAADYPQRARAALLQMIEQVERIEFARDGEDEVMVRGVIVRHMVLPGQVEESKRVLELLRDVIGTSPAVKLSLMSQYTPVICKRAKRGDKRAAQALALYPALARTVDASEYDEVLDYADELGFDEYYWQEGNAASESFIPLFPS